MWKKLYSNSGIILLAIFAAGIWFHNILSLFQPKNTPKYAESTPFIQPTPKCVDLDALTAPTPRKSAEEILGLAPSPSPTPLPSMNS
jgi:hypothetical protein